MLHETQRLKDAMSSFATGVAVITAHYQEQDWGMTCNSFSSVSLDPAMVLWSIRKSSLSLPAFSHSKGFTVNVLAAHQLDIAIRFTKGEQAERFENLSFTRLASERTRINGALAWFDCALDNTVSAGDHDIFIGRVLQFGGTQDAGVQGLIYHQRQFGALQSLEELAG